MHEAPRQHRAAERCLGSVGPGHATRLVLSLLFKAFLGIPRIFHFETLDDPGVAILTGGRRVLSRSRLGHLVRAVAPQEVHRFVQETTPSLTRADRRTISIDEHAVPRFTRKFDIPKGFHTIRNKKMKIEKLTFAFDGATHQLCALKASPGDAALATEATALLPTLRRHACGAPLRLLLDAGAAHNHDTLLDLVARENQVSLVRVVGGHQKAEKSGPGAPRLRSVSGDAAG
jgi:hypothetical protein